MSNFRTSLFGALALMTLATAAGCGTQGLPTTGTATARTSLPTISAAGQTRQLGYDVVRYEKTKVKHERKVKMPRQGLLPRVADNRAFCSPVADQGKIGACTAFAMGKGMREFLQRKNGEANQAPLSALFLYYNERVLNGTVNQDSGATMDEGMESLTNDGIATEETWAYDITQFKVKPPQAAYASAGQFKIHDSTQLSGLDDVKAVLAKGQVVAFGFRVYESFRKIGPDGMMPVPAPGEKMLGGHAVLAVGYDDEKKALIVRNSWGEKWADKGYFYMPYEVAGSSAARQFFTATH